MIRGWYYLHINEDLMAKNKSYPEQDLLESDLVRCYWPIDPSDREGAWNILVESSALGVQTSRVFELASRWNCTNKDARFYADKVGIKLFVEHGAWCATVNDLGPSGLGLTALEAMADLCMGLGLRAEKGPGRSTFKSLVSEMKIKETETMTNINEDISVKKKSCVYHGEYFAIFEDGSMTVNDGVGFIDEIEIEESKRMYDVLKYIYSK